MKRLFVTGAGGFVGGHLQQAVASGEFGPCEWWPAPEHLDIRYPLAIATAVEAAQPDQVIHLAARSFVPDSFADPKATFEVNLFGTLHLLQALKATGFRGRLLYVSSGDVYGHVPESALPVTESWQPAPRSPYAVSKLAAEMLCMQWHRSEGLDVVIARPFNHVGPGQDARFVLPALASQVAAIAAGRQPPVIEAGDIDVTRDFTDVRDIVSAYASLLRAGETGQTYLIGSGQERSVRDLLVQLCSLAGIEPRIRQDPARLRPAEQRRMAASNDLLRNDTGWTPRIPFQTTLQDVLEDAKERIRHAPA